MLLRTEDKSQSPRNIIEYCNAEMFRYDDYVAISVFKLLSYVVVVDVWLNGWNTDNKVFFLDRLVTFFSGMNNGWHGLFMSERTTGNR